MWLSKLKKKKVQYLLLGVIFTIAIALVSVSTIVTVVANTFVTKYYEGDSTPDIHVLTTNKSVVDKTSSWYELKGSEVRNYKNYNMFSVSTNLSFNNVNNDSPISFVIPIEDIKDLSNKVNIVDGDKKAKAPNKGEVWIPSTISKLKEISIGDTASIIDSNGDTLEFKVSGVITDSNQSTTSMGILYIYVNEEDRESLKALPSANSITMNCDGDLTEESKDLVSYINEPIGGIVGNKDLYIMSATMTPSLVGGLGLMASIILIIGLMVILRSNIKNNILKEYKSIGVYKAMGYSSKKIRKIYMSGYTLVSICSSLLGILISIPIVTYLCNIIFEYLGVYSFDLVSLGIVTIAFILFNLIVYVNVYGVLRVVNKIKPVDAINIGVTSSKEKFKKSVIENNSSSLAMAINDIFKYKKSNFIIVIIFTLVFYVSILFLNVANTMLTLDKNLYKIFGTAKSDLVVAAPTDIEDSLSDIKTYLDKDDRVEGYYLWDVLGKNKISIDNTKYKVDSGLLNTSVYDKYNDEDFSITEGRNPRNRNEVSLSTVIMKENELKIGDYITINVEGENRELLISGTYSSMMSNGQSLRVTSDILKDRSTGNVTFVKLKNTDNYDAIKKDIDSQFKGVTVDNIYTALKDTASQVVDTAVPISSILLVGVLAFGLINIMNTLKSSNLDNRKNYGIMKSLGFTSKYIKRRSNYRIMILAILGALIGLTLNLTTSDGLMKVALGYAVFEFSISMTAWLVIISFILIMLIMYVCNKGIGKISTIELIKE